MKLKSVQTDLHFSPTGFGETLSHNTYTLVQRILSFMWLKVGLSILTIHFHSNQSIMSVKGKATYLFLFLLRVNSPHNMTMTQLIVNELCRHGEFAKTTMQSKLLVSP